MNKEDILKLYKPEEKIIIVGCVDIGSTHHHLIKEILEMGRTIIVVSNETEARKEAGFMPILEDKTFLIKRLAPPPLISRKEEFDNKKGNPIDAIAKKRKY